MRRSIVPEPNRPTVSAIFIAISPGRERIYKPTSIGTMARTTVATIVVRFVL